MLFKSTVISCKDIGTDHNASDNDADHFSAMLVRLVSVDGSAAAVLSIVSVEEATPVATPFRKSLPVGTIIDGANPAGDEVIVGGAVDEAFDANEVIGFGPIELKVLEFDDAFGSELGDGDGRGWGDGTGSGHEDVAGSPTSGEEKAPEAESRVAPGMTPMNGMAHCSGVATAPPVGVATAEVIGEAMALGFDAATAPEVGVVVAPKVGVAAAPEVGVATGVVSPLNSAVARLRRRTNRL